MFIKLYKINKRWTSAGKSGDYQYYLSEIVLNASQILYMSEDSDMTGLLKEGNLNINLHKEASFTRLRLSSNRGTEEITVVGDPSIIERKIANTDKTLLKG